MRPDIERAKIIEENIKQIINKCETIDEVGRVRSFYSGETYKLEKVLKIKDTISLCSVYCQKLIIGCTQDR